MNARSGARAARVRRHTPHGGRVPPVAEAASHPTRPAPWPVLAMVGLGLLLYGRALLVGLVGDDYQFLDAALRLPLLELLGGEHGIVGFYRPVARELYFWWWGRVVGLGPLAFHVVNALTYAAVVALLYRFARHWLGSRAGLVAALLFLLFPPGGVLLAWVSCAQDLIALFWTLTALVLHQEGRRWPAGIAVALAGLSKETALIAPAWIAVVDWADHPGARPGERLRRLAPALAGFAVAAGIGVAVRAQWPETTRVAVWSPAQVSGAWMLPWLFVRSLLPPGWSAGLGEAMRTAPWIALGAVALAVLAIPAREMDARPKAAAARTYWHGRVVALGSALWLIGLLPVAFIVERWRAYFFGFAVVGSSLALAAVLARVPNIGVRALVAAAALIHVGANILYRPLAGEIGPARHPHANIAFFREATAVTGPILASLNASCDSLARVSRVFVSGVPADLLFRSVLGPGLRATCRDTAIVVRFLSEMTPAEAGAPFALLRPSSARGGFVFERATAMTRARVGEGFLIHARYDVALACFETAAAERPDDSALAYPLACARAAAGEGETAERAWRGARPADADPHGFALRLIASGPPLGDPARVAAVAADLTPLAAGVQREPWRAEPHRALGRTLLDHTRIRPAVFELATAAGISREAVDLAWLGRGYEAMGAKDEAHAAYRRALALGLEPELYASTKARMLAIGPLVPEPGEQSPGDAREKPQ
ncbi:MAG TPA: glycosyltransferase family 39 protein [Candidatus Limnocylindria bacterium]|nr:glycosyltransferase family 39 protein [Candidatus Limnocylindria bacterium]